MLQFLAPVYLGWSLGANDGANVFGTTVAANMIKFRTAAILCSLFVLLGALVQGRAGMETLSGLSELDLQGAVISSLAAAITVTVMTVRKLPVSTSQAVVGAIIGHGVFTGSVDSSNLLKVIACWVGTPIGAMLVAMLLYWCLRPIFNRLARRIVVHDVVMRGLLVLVGCYGAYALGANNAANVTGIFVGVGALTPLAAAAIAGISISLGVMTFGRGVMMTVGKSIIPLNAYAAFVVVLSEAVTVHFYAVIGVPVSTSQAVIGAVIGVGILKSVETVRLKAVRGILLGWLLTPAAAGACAMALYFVAHLRFVG